MKKLLLFLILCLTPGLAFAGATRGRQEVTRIPYKLRDADCSVGLGCAISLSSAQAKGMDIATFIFESNANTGIQTVEMRCYQDYQVDSQTLVTTQLQTCDFAGGIDNCLSVDSRWSKVYAASVPGAIAWRVDLTGFEQLTCLFLAGNAAPTWDAHIVLSTF